jgi:hypothetical protein
MRIRTIPLIALLIAALAAGSSLAQTSSQKSFAKLVQEDAHVSSSIKRLLQRGAFVDRRVVFGSLTSDKLTDAAIVVNSGGASGGIAVYVFSSDGQPAASAGKLRSVYRTESLYRGSIALVGGKLVVRSPDYAPGDALCCPSAVIERTLAWDKTRKIMRVASTKRIDSAT